MQNKNIKTIIIILSVLLGASTLSLCGILVYRYFIPRHAETIYVPDNVITPDEEDVPGKEDASSDSGRTPEPQQNNGQGSQGGRPQPDSQYNETDGDEMNKDSATGLYLHKNKHTENVPFGVSNMFPGDRITRYFNVKVSYQNKITVRFRTDIHRGSGKLAEVLKVRVKLIPGSEPLYDGLMKDMPKALKHTLESEEETEDELLYKVTVYLDTSAGSEYMEKDLSADFVWQVDERASLKPPKTGDGSDILLWTAAGCVSLILIIFLFKRRKGAGHNK